MRLLGPAFVDVTWSVQARERKGVGEKREGRREERGELAEIVRTCGLNVFLAFAASFVGFRDCRNAGGRSSDLTTSLIQVCQGHIGLETVMHITCGEHFLSLLSRLSFPSSLSSSAAPSELATREDCCDLVASTVVETSRGEQEVGSSFGRLWRELERERARLLLELVQAQETDTVLDIPSPRPRTDSDAIL